MDKRKLTPVRAFRKSLRRFERVHKMLMEDRDCCSGLTITQCHPILEIDELGKTNLSELASILNLDPSSLSRTVEALVQQELVRREPDNRDRRFVVLSLTPAGKKISDEINGKNDLFYDEILSKLPEKKRGAAIRLLDDLVQAVNSTISSCPECSGKGPA